MEYAKEQARDEGLAKGLFEENVSIDIIRKVTGLSEEELQSLRSS